MGPIVLCDTDGGRAEAALWEGGKAWVGGRIAWFVADGILVFCGYWKLTLVSFLFLLGIFILSGTDRESELKSKREALQLLRLDISSSSQGFGHPWPSWCSSGMLTSGL